MRRAILVAALLLACAPARGAKIEHLAGIVGAGVGGAVGSLDVAAEQVLVHFASGTTNADQAAAQAAVGGISIANTSVPGWSIISLSSGASVVPALSILSTWPGVVQASPNRALYLHAVPSDPSFASQYALTKNQGIDATEAWDIETGATNKVTIAVIDSGIDGATQPDVDGKIGHVGVLKSQYFTGNAQFVDDPPTPSCSHATEVSSVAGASANNAVGIAGVSWGAQLISLKVFDPGCATTFDADLSNAINYAANTLSLPANAAAIGKLVVNISIGGAGACTSLPLTQAALANLVTHGVLAAISTGNNGGAVETPANCAGATPGSGIMPVGASDQNKNVAQFSSNGPELAANGVIAPGSSILTDESGGGTVVVSGTSFSAPHVAGVAALMLSRKPTLTPVQLQSMIRQGADNTGIATLGNTTGGGALNAFRAVQAAAGVARNGDLDSKAYVYPNPFRLNTNAFATFNIPKGVEGAQRTIKIYTATGQMIRTLASLAWDGKNDAGALVATGTYLFTIKIDSTLMTGRFAVIR